MPRPQNARPPESTSRVATCLPSCASVRWVTPLTSAPSRTRSVAAARNARALVLSGMSSHSGPTVGICTTWSITEMASNPAASAAAATRRRLAASCGPPPGQANLPRWRAKRSGTGASCWRVAEVGAVRKRAGTRAMASASLTWWTPSKPSVGSAPTVVASACSCDVTIADGTERVRCRLRARVVRSSAARTTACTGTSRSWAMAIHLARCFASSPVVSRTVVKRRRSRAAAMRSRMSNASFAARWSCSSVPTTARRASEDTTALGSK